MEFFELHAAIHEVAGWDSSHLFAFRKGRDVAIEIPTTGIFFNFHTVLDFSKTKLKSFLENPKDTITHEYDFGTINDLLKELNDCVGYYKSIIKEN